MKLLLDSLKMTFRQIRKNKIHSAITLSGLALGLACCLVILLYIRHETSFDRFHAKAGRIYRLYEERRLPEQTTFSAKNSISLKLLPMLDRFPTIEDAVRIIVMGCTVRSDGKDFAEIPYFADPSFLRIFDFPLVSGDLKTALEDPSGLLVSEDFASKAFGDQDPLGKIITVNGKYDFRITGVMGKVPSNSHLRFDILCPFTRLGAMFDDERDYNRCYTYLLVREGASPTDLESEINTLATQILRPGLASIYRFHLQPMTSIHLHSDMRTEISPNNRPGNLIFLSCIALLILLLACINFVNLSTARATRRAKEIGVRKSAGASRRNLIAQFYIESLIMVGLSMLAALPAAQLVLPYFNSLAGCTLTLGVPGDPVLTLGFILMGLATGLAAGIYPALVLSAFSAIDSLKGRTVRKTGRRFGFRKILLFIQFSTAVAFVIISVSVFSQLSFIQKRDLGFSPRGVVELHYAFSGPLQNYPLIRSKILQDPGILDVTGSDLNSPGYYAGSEQQFDVLDVTAKSLSLFTSHVAENFLSFFGVEIVEGRNFTPEDALIPGSALIVNRTAARLLGPDSPLGKQLKTDREDLVGTIVGVSEDYHNVSLYEEIKPAVFVCFPRFSYAIYIKMLDETDEACLEKAKAAMASFNLESPVYSMPVTEIIDRQYQEDELALEIFRIAFVLSLLIAGMGLLGLVLFALERRTKEIGIRKILGASLIRLFSLLTSEYVRLILLSCLIAWPAAYFIVQGWLHHFAYHIHLGPWAFLTSTLGVAGLALVALALPILRAARTNPIESLRYE